MERYRLLPHKVGIAINIPHEYESLVTRVNGRLPIVQIYERERKLAFVNEAGAWGIGGALVRERTTEGTSFIAPLFSCRSYSALSRSINLLQLALTPPDDSDASAPLVGINSLSSGTGNSAHDMSVELSPRMKRLLHRFTEGHRLHIEDIMRITANELGDTRTYPFTCGTRLTLGLVIPGEATWLACDYEPTPNGFAYMRGHNIDHAWQQFALLAGLAEAQAIAEKIGASS